MSDSDEPQRSGAQEQAPQAVRENLLVPGVARWQADQGPLIRLTDVHKSFGDKQVLRGLSLEVRAGEITVIIGASASGKSVLIKLMNGLLKADRGEVLLFGQNTRKLGAVALDELRKRMGTLFQNYALFDSMTVIENVAFPLVQNNAMARAEAHELAAASLTDLGLGDVLNLFPSSLSGGMKKRVSLARAIIANPEAVLFDEPTTGLDPIMMEFVDDMIADIKARYGLTSVIISHDMASTFRLADSIAVLYDGQIIAHDSPEAIRRSEDPRIRQLIFASDKTAIDVSGADDDADDATPGQGADARPRAPGEPQGPLAVEVRGLHKAFDGRKILKGVDFFAPERAISILIGGSGSGKSVLMKHLLGLFRPDAGAISVLGHDMTTISEADLRQLRTRVGMLFQNAALFDSMDIEHNVAFPLLERRSSVPYKEAIERAHHVLEELKLIEVIKRFPSDISNGQQKRVSLARALVAEPQMMIYDEPTTGQDPIMCAYVEQMIVEAQEKFNLTSVIISHDMASTFRIGDHVAMLYQGQIIAQGKPASLLHSTDERVREFVFAADVPEGAASGA